MQNCPLETTKIASVMDLNAQSCRIYTLQKFTAPHEPPAGKALILLISGFVTKLNLYPKNSHC